MHIFHLGTQARLVLLLARIYHFSEVYAVCGLSDILWKACYTPGGAWEP